MPLCLCAFVLTASSIPPDDGHHVRIVIRPGWNSIAFRHLTPIVILIEFREVFPATGNATPEAQEIAELRKKLRRVTEERDILKKQILSHAQDRARLPAALPNPRGGPLGDLRVHRMFLQPNPDALDAGLSITRGV